MTTKKFLVFIPNYNQSLEIGKFLNTLVEHWPREDVIIIDDGSSDSSDFIAEKLGFKIIRHGQNKGVGAAIRTGYHFAKNNGYTHIIMMSANGKMIPAEITNVITPIINEEADYVTGSRYMTGGRTLGLSLFRRVAIPIVSNIYGILLRQKSTDITCGFRCYPINFVFGSNLNIEQPWLNRYEMEYYVHYWACRSGLRIKEVPVTIKYDHLAKSRSSKIKPIVGWWSMMRPLFLLAFGIKK